MSESHEIALEKLYKKTYLPKGKFSDPSFWGKEGLLSFATEHSWKRFGGKGCNIGVTEYSYQDGSRFYVIWSYHPCAHGRRWFKTMPEFMSAVKYVKAAMKEDD